MKIRRFEEKDEAPYAQWFIKRDKPVPPNVIRGHLGFVVEKNGIKLAVGFLLPTSTGVCFLEHIQTNPFESKISQGRALMFLVDAMIDVVRSMGYRSIMGFVEENHRSLKRYYDRIGGRTTRKRFEAYYMEVNNGA